jgi:hypothetical protein
VKTRVRIPLGTPNKMGPTGLILFGKLQRDGNP